MAKELEKVDSKKVTIKIKGKERELNLASKPGLFWKENMAELKILRSCRRK